MSIEVVTAFYACILQHIASYLAKLSVIVCMQLMIAILFFRLLLHICTWLCNSTI